MKPQIVKLDEAALARMGFDRVTIAALRNMVRVTGTDSDSPTVPQLGQMASENAEVVLGIGEQIALLKAISQIIEISPEPISPDLSGIDALAVLPPADVTQQVQQITTEVRQIAEAVAMMREYVQIEVRQLAEQVAQYREHLTTEVRQLADQQIVNANMIQELKQGTML